MYHVCQSVYARGGIHTTTMLCENALPFAHNDPGIAVAEVAPRPNMCTEYAYRICMLNMPPCYILMEISKI